MKAKQIVTAAVASILVLFGLYASFQLFENLDAHELMVVQSPTGELTAYTDPGIKWQGFGTVTKYPRRKQFSFTKDTEGNDNSKKNQV